MKVILMLHQRADGKNISAFCHLPHPKYKVLKLYLIMCAWYVPVCCKLYFSVYKHVISSLEQWFYYAALLSVKKAVDMTVQCIITST